MSYVPPVSVSSPSSANYAQNDRRVAAFLLDSLYVGLAAAPGIIIGILGFVIAGAMDPRKGTSGATSVAVAGMLLCYTLTPIGVLSITIYNAYLLGRDGATLGKRRMHIKALNNSGQPIGFWMALLREVLKSLQMAVCLLLLLWPFWDKNKQGLHDKVTGTNVYLA